MRGWKHIGKVIMSLKNNSLRDLFVWLHLHKDQIPKEIMDTCPLKDTLDEFPDMVRLGNQDRKSMKDLHMLSEVKPDTHGVDLHFNRYRNPHWESDAVEVSHEHYLTRFQDRLYEEEGMVTTLEVLEILHYEFGREWTSDSNGDRFLDFLREKGYLGSVVEA